jgi:hypothetical protein
LHAESVEVSQVAKRADGSSYVTVSGSFTTQQAIERSAFILLQNGTSLQLSLRAASADKAAEGEFLQLLQTVHAAPPTAEGQELSVAVAGDSPVIHRAGPALLTLPPEYQNHTLMRFRNQAGTVVSLTYEENQEGTQAPMEAKGVLGRRIKAMDARGQMFAYEAGEDPWKAHQAKLRSALRSSSAAKIEATQVRELADNKRIVVRVHGPASDVASADLADQMMSGIKVDGEPVGQALSR